MFAAERHRLILERVRSRGSVSVRELVEVSGASEVTVRRDLRLLETEGLVERRRGGATLPGRPAEQQAVRAATAGASGRPAPPWAAIAELAATLVEPGDAVVLGAGAATELLADRLASLPALTVVTNSLLVGEALARSQSDVVMTGGSVHGSTYALVGSAAEESLEGLRVRRAFLSGDGLTATGGLSAANLSAARVDRAIAQVAQEVLVLVDHTRVGTDSMFRTVAPERVAHVVTDDGVDPAQVAALRRAGIVVHVAEER